MKLFVRRLTPDARIPTRGSAFAAGYDLYSAEAATVPGRERRLISTGICITIPNGHYGRIAPRSGLAVKHGIDVGAGVIDVDFIGEIKVLLFNHGKFEFKISKGDRIAQLIVEAIAFPEVKEVNELAETKRGSGGFGSTGN